MSLSEQPQRRVPYRGRAILERLAETRDWDLEHRANGDVVLGCEGAWCGLDIHFGFNEEYQSLHITCCMDMRLPIEKTPQISELLSVINSKLWIGHFAIAPDSRMPAYRHTLLMLGDETTKSLEIEDIIETALGECDRFYPAFQFVGWGGQSANDAMTSALFECVGEA